MIDAIIFDLDGTIINSEPLWLEAGKQVLSEEGLLLTDKEMMRTEGLSTRDAVKLFYSRFKNPGKTIDEVTKSINTRALELILGKGKLQPGIMDMIYLFSENNIPLAVASSTVKHLIDDILVHFSLNKYFSVVCSAESEPYGKPHPGIYLTAAKKLNADPEKCVAIEDSFYGMIAAKAARMKLIVYLEGGKSRDTKYDFADLKLESFHNFSPSDLEYLHSIA